MTDNNNSSNQDNNSDMYKVVWEKDAQKDVMQLSKPIVKAMVLKIKTYLILAPLELGKPLTAKWSGFRSYRHDDYRIIYMAIAKDRMIIITKIGHRSDVY